MILYVGSCFPSAATALKNWSVGVIGDWELGNKVEKRLLQKCRIMDKCCMSRNITKESRMMSRFKVRSVI
jgi:hypothetical protein